MTAENTAAFLVASLNKIRSRKKLPHSLKLSVMPATAVRVRKSFINSGGICRLINLQNTSIYTIMVGADNAVRRASEKK